MRILIIEDDKKIRNILKKGLENEFFAVDSAEEGEKGMEMALSNEYDVIILDNVLPLKKGIDICKDLRKTGETVPILMLSVQSDIPTKVELLSAGADDYLTKPFSFEEVLARIRALLRRPKKIKSDILKFDNLIMDLKKYLIKRGKEKINLTKKEFMLLEYFLRNKNTVLSRGMILEHVCDMNADPFSNTIESHILSLRKKINLKGMKKLIYTVPGRGYRISNEYS
jgi:DNA-binding response OmpR family regulator